MQLLSAADAKVAYGLIKNWEPLKAVVQALVEEETITGDRLNQILIDSDAEFFPDPFVAGFDQGEDGNIVYPGSDKPDAEQVRAAVEEASLFNIMDALQTFQACLHLWTKNSCMGTDKCILADLARFLLQPRERLPLKTEAFTGAACMISLHDLFKVNASSRYLRQALCMHRYLSDGQRM